jgi:hypothetical protein
MHFSDPRPALVFTDSPPDRSSLPYAKWEGGVHHTQCPLGADAVEKYLVVIGESWFGRLRFSRRRVMMGRQKVDQCQLFYLFNLEGRIPTHHLLRRINPVVARIMAELREKLGPFYSEIGRPSIDPELARRAATQLC